MAKSQDRTLLYALIAAGQHAHRALLRPLVERSLQPGDDAILFLAGTADGVSEADLAAATGIGLRTLLPRLERLVARGLIARRAVGAELTPGYGLTDAGTRVRIVLGDHWGRTEAALLEGLDRKDRKRLRRLLMAFAAR